MRGDSHRESLVSMLRYSCLSRLETAFLDSELNRELDLRMVLAPYDTAVQGFVNNECVESMVCISATKKRRQQMRGT